MDQRLKVVTILGFLFLAACGPKTGYSLTPTTTASPGQGMNVPAHISHLEPPTVVENQVAQKNSFDTSPETSVGVQPSQQPIRENEPDSYEETYQPARTVKPLEQKVIEKQKVILGSLNDYNHLWVNIFPNLAKKSEETYKFYPPADDPKKFELSSQSPMKIIRMSDNSVLISGRNVSFDLGKTEMKIDDTTLPYEDVLVQVASASDSTSMEACWNRSFHFLAKCYSYRGIFKITKRQMTDGEEFVNAVNIVGVKDYLRGVIKNEMGANPKQMSAIQAQSVAAETYAIYKKIDARINRSFFENNGFEIFSTQESQVYTGIKGENSITNTAIDSTYGNLLFHKGRIILSEFFSSAGGKTDTVWNVPYMIGKYDPGTVGHPRNGHGRGMSQKGAQYLSEVLKWSYEDILRYYYTDVTISRLDGIGS